MTAHNMNRPRGLLAVRAHADRNEPAAVLAALRTGFEDFKSRNDGRLTQLEGAFDDQARRIAALSVGPGGGSPEGAVQAGLRVNLGEFARSGHGAALAGMAGNGAALAGGFRVSAALSTGSNPDGGFTVPTELSRELISRQRDESAMRRLARVVETSSDTFEQPVNLGGSGSGWVSESEARPETQSPNFGLIEIPSGEVYANAAVTQKLLDDAIYNIGTFLEGEIAADFNEKEGAAFLTGDGINKPRGFLTNTITNEDDAARAFGSIQYTPTGDAAGFAATDPGDALVSLVFTLKAKHRQAGAWLMNSKTLSAVMKFKDGQGNYLWQRGFDSGSPLNLVGYPVEVDEAMPDVAANAHPIAFGDWARGYIITDRNRMRLLRDPYTAKPKILFYATKRVGGSVLDSNAIKLLKIAAA